MHPSGYFAMGLAHGAAGIIAFLAGMLKLGIAVEVDIRIGMTVAHEELFETKRAAGVRGTDKDCVANAVRDEFEPAKLSGPEGPGAAACSDAAGISAVAGAPTAAR